jgi:putative transposase
MLANSEVQEGTQSVASFRYPQGFMINGNCVYLPKIGWCQFHKSREIIGTENCTVSKRGKHWYISVQTEMSITNPIHPGVSFAGADMGS